MRTPKLTFAAVVLVAAFTATGAMAADSPAGTDLEVQFVQLDADSDGYVALGEWTGGSSTFDSLDRDGDAVITRNEFFARDVRYKNRDERFRDLDTDRDGRLSASEWKWGAETLSILDSNGDGFLSRREFRARSARSETTSSAAKK